MSYANLSFIFFQSPYLSVWPSFAVLNKSNVTVECMNFVEDTKCDIIRGGINLDPRIPLSLTERASKSHLITEVLHCYKFYLIELEQSDTRQYICECWGTDVPDVLLLHSDENLILVTGEEGLPQDISVYQREKGREKRVIVLRAV